MKGETTDEDKNKDEDDGGDDQAQGKGIKERTTLLKGLLDHTDEEESEVRANIPTHSVADDGKDAFGLCSGTFYSFTRCRPLSASAVKDVVVANAFSDLYVPPCSCL